MKNLILYLQQRFALDTILETNFQIVGFSNCQKDTFFTCTSNETIHLKEKGLCSETTQVVAIQFVSELESVCIACSTGEIITYHITSKLLDCVGTIEEGILDMSWSPDQEIVLFATGANQILTMTKEWETISEVPIESVPIKPQPKPVQIQYVQTGKQNEQMTPSHLQAKIIWRQDGEMYAVSAFDSTEKRQVIRVWERIGSTFSKSEPINGLGNVLHWKPDGSIIASHQYLENKKETNIVFFEKNGLQHYSFTLYKGPCEIHQIQWNLDSELLFVLFTPAEQSIPLLQIWYRSNYFWYLKQEFAFASVEEAPHFAYWDSELPQRLHFFCNNKQYFSNDLTWHCQVQSNHACVAAIIHGNNLQLTPMRYAMVPPPMCTESINFKEEHINRVCFAGQEMLVQCSNGHIQVYSFESNGKPPKFGLPPKLNYSIQLKEKHYRLTTLLSNQKGILAVKPSAFNENEELDWIDPKKEETNWKQSITVPGKIIAIVEHEYSGNVFIELADGTVLQLNLTTLQHKETHHSFHHPCQQMAVCTMGLEETVIGFHDKGILYIQGNVAASNCNSFALHDQFLLFTTYTHKLRVIPLHLPIYEALDLASHTNPSKYDDTFRDVERGAKLVCAVPLDFKLILQMPRGNLEGIYPRALVLNYLKHLLYQNKYKEAILIARKYKVDMNVIFDHHPEQFLNNAQLFVQQVDNTEFINLFLSQLSEEDITKTKYSSYFTEEEAQERKKPFANKINSICIQLRESMEKVNAKKFVSSILTTFARLNPPNLEAALEKIKALKVEEDSGVELPEDRPSSDETLDYLVFIANVNHLYDVALGMYDFNLVKMVAKKSEKDPKEYLSFLSKLEQMEPHFQHYTIDMHLKRYEKALRNIAQSEKPEHFTEELLPLVKEFGMYKLALEIFAQNKEKHAAIMNIYADYLAGERKHSQAAFGYLQAKQIAKALHQFKEAGNFKMAFALSKQLNQTKEEARSLARQMADILETSGKFLDCATVHREYLNDNEQAIVVLSKGLYFSDALRVAAVADRKDLIELHIKSAVMDSFKERMQELEENQDKIVKYITRLVELREERRKQQEELINQQLFIEGALPEDMLRQQNMDAFSDTSSMQSGVSGYSGVSAFTTASTLSNRSGRSYRETTKSRNKKIKIRKGSPFEETNIISRLNTLIPSVSQQEDISRLIAGLIYFGYFDEAKKIQTHLISMIEYAKSQAELIEAPYPEASENESSGKMITPKKVAELIGNVSWTLDILL